MGPDVIEVRAARSEDAGALAQIFYRAIRIGAAPAYTDAQRAAWAPHLPTGEAFAKRLTGLVTRVAESVGPDGVAISGPIGFTSLRLEDGYLDLAFVDPDWTGRGVFARLYADLETQARAAGLGRLHTQASALLKPVLLRRGWTQVRANTVTRGAQTLPNWIMAFDLC